MIPRTFAPGEVPSTFAPQVTQGETPMTPTGSPWVTPMRNAAPGQLQQDSATEMQAGEAMSRIGNTIGDRVQETMDDAVTKAAETQFLSKALPTLGQYKTTEGINATAQYDPTAQAIAKMRQDARAGLTSPIQQRMFDQVTNEHMLTFGQQMADHENVQRVQYGKDQSKARAENLNTMATLDVPGRNREDSQFSALGAQSDQEMLHYASLNGIAPDSPQAEQLLRQNRTERYRSVVSALLDQHAYSEANDFFEEHKAEMDVKQAEVLGNAVKTAAMQVEGTDWGNRAIQSLQKTKGAGPLSFPIPAGTISTTAGEDGVDIHAAPGTNVIAPANGTVSKVWKDDEKGLSVQVSLPSGYTATLSGLGAVNYKEGQRITAGQVLGLSGQDDNGRAVTHYAMTDSQGGAVGDPRSAVSAPFDPQSFSAPGDEAKAVEYLNQNVADEVLRRVAVNRVESLANHNRQITSQEHAAALKQATDYWFQNKSLAGLPPDVAGQLSPEDLDGFSQQAKAKNDVNLMASWIEHRETQTVDAVKTAYAQGRLSDNGYLSALRDAMAMQGADTGQTDADKVRAVTVDHDQLTNILALNNLPNLAMPKENDQTSKLARVQLEEAVKNEIDVMQQRAGRTLNMQEKAKIMRDMVVDKVYTSTNMFGQPNGDPKPAATATADELRNAQVWIGNEHVKLSDIPPGQSVKAMQDLEGHGLPVTQANIAKWWLTAGRPQ